MTRYILAKVKIFDVSIVENKPKTWRFFYPTIDADFPFLKCITKEAEHDPFKLTEFGTIWLHAYMSSSYLRNLVLSWQRPDIISKQCTLQTHNKLRSL